MEFGIIHPAPDDEQKMLADTVRDLATERVAPHAATIDREAAIPADVSAALVELGLFGIAIPEALGGTGFDALSQAMAAYELAKASGSVAAHYVLQSCCVAPALAHLGRADLVAELVSGINFAIVFDDAHAGPTTDAHGPEIVDVAGRTVLRGGRSAVLGAADATWLVVFAKDGTGTSAVVIKGDAPGVRRSARQDRLGLRTLATCDVAFADAVPAESSFLSRRGAAAATIDLVRLRGAIGFAALGAGLIKAALEAALTYAGERRQFGVPIASFEALREKFADMAVAHMGLSSLVATAARAVDAGRADADVARAALLSAATGAMQAADSCLQIHGGYGYSQEYPAERIYRDARYLAIALGGEDLCRLELAATLDPTHA